MSTVIEHDNSLIGNTTDDFNEDEITEPVVESLPTTLELTPVLKQDVVNASFRDALAATAVKTQKAEHDHPSPEENHETSNPVNNHAEEELVSKEPEEVTINEEVPQEHSHTTTHPSEPKEHTEEKTETHDKVEELEVSDQQPAEANVQETH